MEERRRGVVSGDMAESTLLRPEILVLRLERLAENCLLFIGINFAVAQVVILVRISSYNVLGGYFFPPLSCVGFSRAVLPAHRYHVHRLRLDHWAALGLQTTG